MRENGSRAGEIGPDLPPTALLLLGNHERAGLDEVLGNWVAIPLVKSIGTTTLKENHIDNQILYENGVVWIFF